MQSIKMCFSFSITSLLLLTMNLFLLSQYKLQGFEQFWRGVNREISICRALYSFQSTFILSVSSKPKNNPVRKVSLFFTNALRQQPGEGGTHQTLLKEATNQQNAICQGFLLLACYHTLPAGRLWCSSRTWLQTFLAPLGLPSSTAGQWLPFGPSAAQVGLALCQLLFGDWLTSLLAGIGVGLSLLCTESASHTIFPILWSRKPVQRSEMTC